MITVTVTGNAKVVFNKIVYRPGQTFEIPDHRYNELISAGVSICDVREVKEEIKTKPKKENDKLENNT